MRQQRHIHVQNGGEKTSALQCTTKGVKYDYISAFNDIDVNSTVTIWGSLFSWGIIRIKLMIYYMDSFVAYFVGIWSWLVEVISTHIRVVMGWGKANARKFCHSMSCYDHLLFCVFNVRKLENTLTYFYNYIFFIMYSNLGDLSNCQSDVRRKFH